ncbi:MAG: acetoacetate--CoA ligase, partial [Myxococcales bacterium]|nr:acetoacetate--CoA ligase [Myxococcales bacterium]
MWAPSRDAVARAQLEAFRARAERASGERLPDYAALHAWSVRDRGAFWELVWELADVVGERGDGPALVDDGAMRDARFFPAARLNFAENLLRGDGDATALRFRGE